METRIRLVEVDYWNFDSLIDLKVKESQKGYVATIAREPERYTG